MKVFDFENLILKERIFGLEILDDLVKVLELKRSGGKFSVIGFAEVKVDKAAISNGVIINKELLADTIKQARENARPRRLKTRFASVVIPDSRIFVRVVRFPSGMTKEEIREAVEWKAKDLIAMPLEKVYWDWHRLVLDETKKDTEVVISAVDKECADSYTQTLELLDITPVYYDISGNAAARFLFQNEYMQKRALLVRIDRDTTTLSLFLNGGVRYQTIIKDYIKGGYGALVDVASSKLGIDPSQVEKLILSPKNLNNKQKALLQETYTIKYDSLKNEIDQILDYYNQRLYETEGRSEEKGSKLDGIYLYGKGATIFEAENLSEGVQITLAQTPTETSAISPILQFISRQHLFENLVILGLSLRNLGLFKELRDINLVARSIKEKYLQVTIYSNLYMYLRIIFWNTFIITLMLTVSFLIALIYEFNVENDLKAVENLAESEAIQQLQENILYVNGTLVQIETLINSQLDWDEFFNEVSKNRGEGISYFNLLISEDPSALKAVSGREKIVKKEGYLYLVISGIAGSREDLQRYIQSMEDSDIFEEARMPISNYEQSVDIDFTIYCIVNTNNLKRTNEE